MRRWPAVGPSRTVSYPLKPNQPPTPKGAAPVPIPSVPDKPGKVCTNKSSIRFHLDDGGKFQQHYRHYSEEWNRAHKYGRQTVESYNRSLKDRGQGGSGYADSRRLRGVTAQSFLVLLGVVATNLRRIDEFLADVRGLYGRKAVAPEARHSMPRTSRKFADATRTKDSLEAREFNVNPAARPCSTRPAPACDDADTRSCGGADSGDDEVGPCVCPRL